MFDLNNEMRNWRRRVLRGGACTPADVEELSSHLEDDIECLRENGLSEEEAFLVATHRLGADNALRDEYGKINPGRVWQQRLVGALAAYLFIVGANCLINLFSQSLVFAGLSAGLNNVNITVLDLALKLVFVTLAAWIILMDTKKLKYKLIHGIDGIYEKLKSHYIIAVLLWVAVYSIGSGLIVYLAFAADGAACEQLLLSSNIFEGIVLLIAPCFFVLLMTLRRRDTIEYKAST